MKCARCLQELDDDFLERNGKLWHEACWERSWVRSNPHISNTTLRNYIMAHFVCNHCGRRFQITDRVVIWRWRCYDYECAEKCQMV